MVLPQWPAFQKKNTKKKNLPVFVPYLNTAYKGENISMTTEQGGTRQARKIAVDTQDLPLRGSRLTQIISVSLWLPEEFEYQAHVNISHSQRVWTQPVAVFVVWFTFKRTAESFTSTQTFTLSCFFSSSPTKELMQCLLPLSSGENVLRFFFLFFLLASTTFCIEWLTANKAISDFLIHLLHFFSQSVVIPSCVSFHTSLIFNGHNISQ